MHACIGPLKHRPSAAHIFFLSISSSMQVNKEMLRWPGACTLCNAHIALTINHESLMAFSSCSAIRFVYCLLATSNYGLVHHRRRHTQRFMFIYFSLSLSLALCASTAFSDANRRVAYSLLLLLLCATHNEKWSTATAAATVRR